MNKRSKWYIYTIYRSKYKKSGSTFIDRHVWGDSECNFEMSKPCAAFKQLIKQPTTISINSKLLIAIKEGI